MSNIKEYDEKGNLIHQKDVNGRELWYKYDKNDNEIYYKIISNYYFEKWVEYDQGNRCIHYINSDDLEIFYKYDKYGMQFSISEKEYNWIQFKKKEKEYLSRKKVTRFELMDI